MISCNIRLVVTELSTSSQGVNAISCGRCWASHVCLVVECTLTNSNLEAHLNTLRYPTMDGKAFTVESLAPRQLTCLRHFFNRPATVPSSFTSRSNTIRLNERNHK